MIEPPPLRPGDTIAIVPTARAITPDELRDGIELAESWGLKVRLGAGVGRKHFQQAGTDQERTADLQAAIDDREVRAIWCARGGYGTVRLLDRLDVRGLLEKPKWIAGFSDITALHNMMHGLGLRTLHAQMPFNIRGKTSDSKEGLRRALFGEEAGITATAGHYLDRPGRAEGMVVGGNLSMLYSLRGTPADLDPAGKILFLEDLDELLYHVDRMIQNLRISGWFKQLKGLIIGAMTDMRNKNELDPFGRSAEEIIADAVGEVDYPVTYGFPAGHIDDNRALIFGKPADLIVTRENVTLRYVP